MLTHHCENVVKETREGEESKECSEGRLCSAEVAPESKRLRFWQWSSSTGESTCTQQSQGAGRAVSRIRAVPKVGRS